VYISSSSDSYFLGGFLLGVLASTFCGLVETKLPRVLLPRYTSFSDSTSLSENSEELLSLEDFLCFCLATRLLEVAGAGFNYFGASETLLIVDFESSSFLTGLARLTEERPSKRVFDY
jgi:hypothetical protein